MKIPFRKIKRDKYDDLLNSVLETFKNTGKVVVNIEDVEDCAEDILIMGKQIKLDIDVDKYLGIANADTFNYDKNTDIAMMLYMDFRSDDVIIPRNILCEKEVWTYYSLTVLKDVVDALKMSDPEKISENKIKQFYFNAGTVSRTGLLFLWTMADRLKADDRNFIHTAFEFVDPVKAIFERTMSKNDDILRAYVQALINNGKDARFKKKEYRASIPSHISCFASINMLDAYDYDKLVSVIEKEQQELLNI